MAPVSQDLEPPANPGRFKAVTNVIVGFGLAVLTQMLVFPGFGLIVAFDQHVSIAVIFTMLSLGRGYILRRLFEGLA